MFFLATLRVFQFIRQTLFKRNLRLLRVSFAKNKSLDAGDCASTSKKADKAPPAGKKIKEKLIKPLIDDYLQKKITIVGAGQVGIATAICILTQKIASKVCFIDTDHKKLLGDLRDFQDGTSFLNNPIVLGGTDYALSKNSSICILTAGIRPKKGQTRLETLNDNAKLYKQIVPELIKHSPDAILVVVGNPCDVITYIVWKISKLPLSRVYGTGTSLDTSRFRLYLSERLNIAPRFCHAWIIGEHGQGAVPVWSTANVGGVRLHDLNPKIGQRDDPEKWYELYKRVITAAAEVSNIKGYTSWAIGLCAASMAKRICQNTAEIDCVSTNARGAYGIDKDVFLSLPGVLDSSGLSSIVNLTLTEAEQEHLRKTADKLNAAQESINL